MKRLLLICLVIVSACSDNSSAPPVEPVPDSGRMLVQISGAVQATREWNSYGEFHDLLASATNELSLLGGQRMNPVGADSNFTLVFPGRLEVGQFAIGRYTLGVIPSTPAAYVILDSTFYASLPGGTLKVTSAEYPTRPGLLPGLVRGTFDFKAVRLADSPGGPVATSDTITVHAAFAAHWSHYLFPNVSVTVNGAGPVTGTSTLSFAQSLDDDHGGRFIELSSDFGASHLFPHDLSQELRVRAPAVGTFTLTPTTPGQFADPNAWPPVYAALFYRDDPRIGLSTGGTLTITKFLTPTDEFYGEIQGTLTTPVALWTNTTTVSADTVNLAITFAVQLWPLGGIPSSARR